MKKGQASQTAVLVCEGRAVAHREHKVKGFSDPTALALLPDEARARLERSWTGPLLKRLRARVEGAKVLGRSAFMAVRTVEIDDAIRAAAAPQLVILGAGLDGRAWRMGELRGRRRIRARSPRLAARQARPRAHA